MTLIHHINLGVVGTIISASVLGCIDTDEATIPTQEASQELQAAESLNDATLFLPKFHSDWDAAIQTRGICELRTNATTLHVGEVVSVTTALRNGTGCDPLDYEYAAPTRLVTVRTETGDHQIRFLEKHFTHTELQPGVSVFVGTRKLDGEWIGLGYLLKNTSRAVDESRGVVDLSSAGMPVEEQFSAAKHCGEMTDAEFRTYVKVPDKSAMDCLRQPPTTQMWNEVTDEQH